MKWVFRVLLGLLLMLLLLVAILHLPPVQKAITSKTANYLSDLTGAGVSIENIHVSLWDGAAIKGLEVRGRQGEFLFSVQRVGILPDIMLFISGTTAFSYLGVEGFKGSLINGVDGLNIQFIIDAFQTTEASATDSESDFLLQIDRLRLEEIDFEYRSEVDSIFLDLWLGHLDIEDLNLSAPAKTVKISGVRLSQTVLELQQQSSENEAPFQLPPLDFGSGLQIEVGEVILRQNHLTVHSGQPSPPPGSFDPGYLEVNELGLQISRLVVNSNRLELQLEGLQGRLPELNVLEAKGALSVDTSQLSLSGFNMVSDSSQVSLDLKVSYEQWTGLLQHPNQMEMFLDLTARLHPGEFRYLLADSLLCGACSPFEVALSGHLEKETFDIGKFELVYDSSQILVSGTFDKILVQDSITWDHLIVQADMRTSLMSLIKDQSGIPNLPPDLKMELSSSGSLKGFNLQSIVVSSKGRLDIEGSLSVLPQPVFDLQIGGDNLDLKHFTANPALGTVDFKMKAFGNPRSSSGLELKGDVHRLIVSGQRVGDIAFNGVLKSKQIDLRLVVQQPGFEADISTQVQMGDHIDITSRLYFNRFNAGILTGNDSLFVSGEFQTTAILDRPNYQAAIRGSQLRIIKDTLDYQLDSISLDFQIAPDLTKLQIDSDHIVGILEANVNAQSALELVTEAIQPTWATTPPSGQRRLSFLLNVSEQAPVRLFYEKLQAFSGLHAEGMVDERAQQMEIKVETPALAAMGIKLDSLVLSFFNQSGQINSVLDIEQIHYDSLLLGRLNIDLVNLDPGILSKVRLRKDTLTLLSMTSNLETTPSGITVRLDSLVIFDEALELDSSNRFMLANDHFTIENFKAVNRRLGMEIAGDNNRLDLKIIDADLRQLGHLLQVDTTTISSGLFSADISYSENEPYFDLEMNIDSLVFNDYPAIDITAQGASQGDLIPFQLALNSTTNKISLEGTYFKAQQEISADLDLDVSQLEMFYFLVSDQLQELNGRLRANTRINGPLQSPVYLGSITFEEVNFTLQKPRIKLQIKEQELTLDNSGLAFNDFTIFDQWQNPLVLDGVIGTKDYRSFDYDLSVVTDNYLLIDNPELEQYQLQGRLVIGSDLKLKGNQKDTSIDAKIAIKDTTDLTYVLPAQNLELLSSDGIVEFVDPDDPPDTLNIRSAQSFYDSLMSTLPSFNLTSSVTLGQQAVLRVLIDPRSGDFIEASGDADLRLEVDRTGNVQLEGKYSITRGFYQLSFYDMVKKNFEISPGSTVEWSGNPNQGELNFKAVHRINTSSIGLIGHEIGENEREVYRKSLPYQVAIVITGTLERPIIAFDLDLPQSEKLNYPALSNKLDRLKQPEFESELNKQVFGLLVLGGFIPEQSGSDFDESLIATTALSNSVNSILASQLNRFAGQLVKGVDINVGLQTYSDFSTGGGQTRTAMDFRLTKRMMDDRLSIEVGGGMDINASQSGANTGSDNFRGDITVIYDLTESGRKQLKLFNNETYDIIYHEIRNTGISLIFIRDFDKGEKATDQ